MHCLGWSGHVHPLLSVAAALRSRGHEVALLTATPYRRTVEAVGVTYVPPGRAPDRDYNRQATDGSMPRLPHPEPLARLFGSLAVEDAAAQGNDVAIACTEWRPDLLINDGIALGVPLAAGLLRRPWATVSPFLFLTLPARGVPPPFLALPWRSGPWGRVSAALAEKLVAARLAPESRRWRALARAWKLPKPAPDIRTAGTSPLLYLYPGGPPLEYPRRRWPAHVHGVGPLLLDQDTPPPPPGPPPRAFLTEGTTHADQALARLAIRALAGTPVHLDIALADRRAIARLEPIPPNVRLLGYVDYRQALREAAILITNGGAGSLAAALAAGVPALMLPAGLDKREATRRLAWAGAGIRLPPAGRCSAHRLRAAVRTLLDEPVTRNRAQAVGQALVALGGAGRAAELLEAALP